MYPSVEAEGLELRMRECIGPFAPRVVGAVQSIIAVAQVSKVLPSPM